MIAIIDFPFSIYQKLFSNIFRASHVGGIRIEMKMLPETKMNYPIESTIDVLGSSTAYIVRDDKNLFH